MTPFDYQSSHTHAPMVVVGAAWAAYSASSDSPAPATHQLLMPTGVLWSSYTVTATTSIASRRTLHSKVGSRGVH